MTDARPVGVVVVVVVTSWFSLVSDPWSGEQGRFAAAAPFQEQQGRVVVELALLVG